MRLSMAVLLMALLLAVAAYARDESALETVPTPADTVVVTEPDDAGFEPLEHLQPTIDVVYRTATPVNATAAVLMSPIFPGWGQLYSDNGWRAVLAFGAEMWFWSRMLMYDRKAVRFKQYEDQATSETAIAFYQTQIPEYWELMRDNAWWSGGALLIIAVDAYVDAHLHRFDEDPVPVPNNWEPGDQPQPIELPNRAAPPTMVVFGWSTDF
jgi:hypothetical protein